MTTQEILEQAVRAKKALMVADTETKDQALVHMAEHLIEDIPQILEANRQDMEDARGSISEVMLDRLQLTEDRIHSMAKGVLQVKDLEDPVGKILSEKVREDGLLIQKRSAAMGVIGIIYESRPNVTSDAAALAVKAGSACVLRCGKEAHRSAEAIAMALSKGLSDAGLPENAVQLVDDTTRASAQEMMHARGKIDLLIPRGGAGLIRTCVEEATVPVIETGTGICHIYVDESADLSMALSIIENAKCSRPSVCNAMEVCLIHQSVAKEFLPMLKERLVLDRIAQGKPAVELRLDKRAAAVIEGVPAGPEDFDTEFLDYKMAVGIVDSVKEAVEHIEKHSTHHSESIITLDMEAADFFTSSIDSAAVYVNASTRFTDGGEFGLGCEMGISTQKLHARGPMGLEELCCYRYVILGAGQIR